LDATTSAIRSSEPVDLSAETDILRSKREKFLRLRTDLERCEPRIVSLQEAADQLELQTEDGDRCRAVKAKLSLLSQKLRVLMNVCEVYSRRLENALRGDDDDVGGEEDEEGGDASPVLPRLSNEVKTRFSGKGIICVFFIACCEEE